MTPSVPNQNSRKPFRIRTWPVFLLGMGSLLVLSFLPGLVVLWRTSRVYPEVRRLQREGLQDSYQLLTEREREVLQLLAEGKSNKEAARMLSLSLHTVETHRTNLMQKLGLHNIAEIVLYSMRKRIIS